MSGGRESAISRQDDGNPNLDDGDSTLIQDPVSRNRAEELSRRPEQAPGKLPGYHIIRCLGEGAYGSVWLASEQNTGKRVAVKFYTHRHGLDWSLLNREVEKLAVLYTSRNIVGLLDVGWESDPPYYVMEYLENGSLASFLTDGPLPTSEAVRIAKLVLQALVHAHGSGILHCDLKPANVLLDSDFAPRLCDFGQSRLSNEQNPALGTLFYMAPEQADLKAIPDARWDVYALGALLYHMLSGAPPYQSADHERMIRSAETLEERLAIYRRILKQSPRPNAHRRSGVDRALADIVDRCLQVDPQKRPPNAQAVLDMLELRERQRSRRPLLALGMIGPGLLLLAMAPVMGDVMRSAVQTARENLVERALESDALSASILARSLEHELLDRRAELMEIASNLELRAAVEEFASRPFEERGELTEILHRWKSTVDARHFEQDRELDASWFLTDADGYQRWREPFDGKTIDKNFAHRDYFHGQEIEYGVDNLPSGIQPIRKPHISTAFRSDATRRYMVAISVPIWDLKHENVLGVLARTTHLGELVAEYGRRIRGDDGDGVNRSVALVDRRDWKLLDHPWMTHGNLHQVSEEELEQIVEKLVLSGAVVEKLNRLQQLQGTDQLSVSDFRDDAYSDPVSQVDPETYGGEWLAAFSPVGDTGWTTIVQERKEVALRPVEEMRAGLIRYGLRAFVVGCGLILLLWYFVQHALNDRNLRGLSRSDTTRGFGSASTVSDR